MNFRTIVISYNLTLMNPHTNYAKRIVLSLIWSLDDASHQSWCGCHRPCIFVLLKGEFRITKNKVRAVQTGAVQYIDALCHCKSNSYSKDKVNVISITKGFVQWAQQLLVPLWDCVCGALLVPLKLEECHQMVKSRSEYVIFHPASFLMVHYSVLHHLLPIMENVYWLSGAKFYSSLITIMLYAFPGNVSMWYDVMYLRSGGKHNVLSVETNFPFGDNKIYPSILQCIYCI